MKVAAVGYVRVSSEEQAMHGLSPDAQRQIIAPVCSGFGEYVITEDLGVSAYKAVRRDGLEQAITLAKENRCPVVVSKVDRFGRLVGRGAVALEDLHAAGAWIIAVQDGIDTSSSVGEQMFHMLLVGAQMESRNRADRTRSTAPSRASKRGHYGGGVFEPAGRNRDWSIYEPEAAAIRRVFDLILVEGMSVGAAARTIAAEGFRSRRGKTWGRQTLMSFLRSPQIAALASFKGELTGERADFPEIVSPEQWHAMQTVVGARSGDRAAVGRTPIAGHLLSTLGRCGLCGSPMLARSPRRKNGVKKMYGCSRHEMGKDLCPMPWLDGDEIDAAFAEHFTAQVLDVEGSIANLERMASAKLADIEMLRREASRAVMAVRENIDRLWREYESASDNDRPSLRFVEERAAKYADDLVAAEQEELRLADREGQVKSEALLGSVREAAEQMINEIATAGHDALRPVIAKVFQEVVFDSMSLPKQPGLGLDVEAASAMVIVGTGTVLWPIPRREHLVKATWSYPGFGPFDVDVPGRTPLGVNNDIFWTLLMSFLGPIEVPS